jgi:hypothetical protein
MFGFGKKKERPLSMCPECVHRSGKVMSTYEGMAYVCKHPERKDDFISPVTGTTDPNYLYYNPCRKWNSIGECDLFKRK